MVLDVLTNLMISNNLFMGMDSMYFLLLRLSFVFINGFAFKIQIPPRSVLMLKAYRQDPGTPNADPECNIRLD